MENEIQVLEYITKSLASYPEEVLIEKTIDERGVLLTVIARKEDLGRLIGRQGSTATAIRSVMRVHGAKNGQRICVIFRDQENVSQEDPDLH